MRIALCRPEEAARIWHHAEQCLAGTLDLVKDTHLPHDVLAAILKGEMFLFLAIEGEKIVGATVCEIVAYPRMRALRVFLGGGTDMPSWVTPMDEAHQAFARARGCGRMEISGRRGWARAAGYEEKGRSLVKGL